ncbi:uncharacterized protein LOC119602494 [Lucilia sericata]|uniref:uncharacterized protein LOC119602494 n=1 Tax=Lucilia sericata TaxID=13632 RepID=UPI0018A80D65|nr:uncharacterized protein LOC119602494 [Lucilia sericata]
MEMESDQTNITNNTTTTTLTANPSVNPPNIQQLASGNSVTNTAPATTANVVTIPVPIVNNEGTYAYITVKGSLHDRSCSVFGLNDTEIQALSKRFENSVKPVVNGVMVSASPLVMLNTLAQLSYKVVCSCGEAEICWTMQREI